MHGARRRRRLPARVLPASRCSCTRRSTPTSRCSSAGRRTATCSARASASSRTSSPAASRRRSCRRRSPCARRVLKLIDVFVYVVVYFIGTLFLVARRDVWADGAAGRLARRLYRASLVYLRAAPQRVLGEQADARAQMTGRIVDSYTNIQTVKLFAHTAREHDYARDAMDEFMDTVLPRRCGWSPAHVCAARHQLGCSSPRSPALAIYAWQQSAVTLGAHRRGDRAGHAHPRHVAVDHVGGRRPLREHRHGAGRHQHHRRSRSRSSTGRTRRRSMVARGEIRFEHVTLPLRPRGAASSRTSR